MRRIRNLCSLLGVICFEFFAATAPGQSGLLLGLSRVCFQGPCKSPERTLWIAPQGGAVKILEISDLVVPRSDGFWRVGVRTYCDPTGEDDVSGKNHAAVVDALFMLPVSQRPIVDGLGVCPKDTDDACSRKSYSIEFVNPDYIALAENEGYECGAHPGGYGSWSVSRLGDPDVTPLSYSSIEGKGAEEEYSRGAAHALLSEGPESPGPPSPSDLEAEKELEARHPTWSKMTEEEKVAALVEEDNGCVPAHDDTQWYIKRMPGRWGADGAFYTARLCGVSVDFELPFHAVFAGPIKAPIPLESIQKQVPDAYDAFWSPQGDLLIVLVADVKGTPVDPDPFKYSLLVFQPHGAELEKPLLTLQLLPTEQPVMAEWATGKNVARWTAELTKIKTRGFQEPLLSINQKP